MALTARGVEKVVREFRRRVEEKISVDVIILFGSRAWGKPRECSDIDIAVISDKFRGMSDIERHVLLSDIASSIPLPWDIEIEAVGFTRRELEKAGYFDLAGEIRDRGRRVA